MLQVFTFCGHVTTMNVACCRCWHASCMCPEDLFLTSARRGCCCMCCVEGHLNHESCPLLHVCFAVMHMLLTSVSLPRRVRATSQRKTPRPRSLPHVNHVSNLRWQRVVTLSLGCERVSARACMRACARVCACVRVRASRACACSPRCRRARADASIA